MERSADKGQVAVITGGGGGMGRAIARRLGKRQVLLLADSDRDKLDAAALDLVALGLEVETLVGDVTDPPFVANLVRVTESLGSLRTLVHAAGLSPSMAPGRRILEVNLVGTALVERAFLPLAIKRTVGIFIASQAGHVPPFGDSRDALLDNPLQPGFLDALASEAAQGADAYSISKRGVIRYCARRTMDWAARSARIMTISPGMIRTPMTEFEFPRQPLMKAMLDLTPMKRWGSAEDIAALVDYIASDEASFLTGTDILIDGGVTPLFAARGR